MKSLALLTILSNVLLLGVPVGAQNPAPADLWAGTWTLNIAKSTFHAKAPQHEVITIAPAGSDTLAFKYTVSGTGAEGAPINAAYDGRKDGKFYPHLVDGKATSEVSYLYESSHRTSCQIKYGDGSTGTETITLSSDGKSFTVHQHVNAKQGAYDETHVFDRG